MTLSTRIVPFTLIATVVLAGVGYGAFSAIRASALENPTVTTAIQNNSNATTTSAAIGTVVHDKVMVATSTGPVFGGTVNFNLYPNTNCSGDPTVQSNVALVHGMATSATTSVPATGLSYKVHYNGQTDILASVDGECEPLIATSSNVGINTTLSTTTAIVGNSAFDSVTLLNTTSNASGTVAYSVFSNTACTNDKRSAGVKTVTNGVVPNSDTLQFNSVGTFYWQAVYSGDSQNSAATSSCTSEILHIVATSTPKGHIIVNKVTIPSGNSANFHFNTGGAGYADFNLTGSSTPNDQELFAGTYSITESFKSGWTLTSSHCSVNGASSSTYTPGSNLVLGSGDTIRCTFTNTKATTTPPTQCDCKHDKNCKHGDNDDGKDGDDGEDGEDGHDGNNGRNHGLKGFHGFPFDSIPEGFPFTHKSMKEFFKKLPTLKDSVNVQSSSDVQSDSGSSSSAKIRSDLRARIRVHMDGRDD